MKNEVSETPDILIKELAEFLALEQNCKPIDLDKIVNSEELSVFYDDYNNSFDGTIIYDRRFYIHINTSRGNLYNSTRGRFTLAHELGHYFIENHRIGLKRGLLDPHPSINNKNNQFKIEREADYFASCLLMPEEYFRKDCTRHKRFSFSVIEELSKIYNVSLTACSIRFATIGTHPIMIVYCEDNHVVWKWYSHDFPYKFLAEKHPIIPIDTLAGDYFKSESGTKMTKQVWAIDWFKYVKDEDINRKFYEHFIPYKNKGLSIIWEE